MLGSMAARVGQLGATPVLAGLLVSGFESSLVDAICAEAMGFDPARIPLTREALGGVLLPSGDVSKVEHRHRRAHADSPLQAAAELVFTPAPRRRRGLTREASTTAVNLEVGDWRDRDRAGFRLSTAARRHV